MRRSLLSKVLSMMVVFGSVSLALIATALAAPGVQEDAVDVVEDPSVLKPVDAQDERGPRVRVTGPIEEHDEESKPAVTRQAKRMLRAAMATTNWEAVRRRSQPRQDSPYSGVAPRDSRLMISCQTWVPSQPVYSNTLWLLVSGGGATGTWWVNDHWTRTPRPDTGPALAGVPMCGTTTGPLVDIGAPCTGRYAWGWIVDPSQHHRPFGGDVATDWFCPPGSSVRVYATSRVPYANPTLVVANVTAACANGVINNGGYNIRVNISVNGTLIGWASYAHIANPTVRSGQTISHGTTLGTTSGWGYRGDDNPCYQVSTTSGVHVHHELYNMRNFACMLDLPFNTPLNAGQRLGTIGGTDRTTSAYCTS